MANLFPRSRSDELRPFVEPFGRMVLAYGRASTALIALAFTRCDDELRAATFVSGTADLPKKMRRLFRGTLDEYRFNQMDRAVRRFSEISDKRHHLIHGEWWFDYLEDRTLKVRRVWREEISHLEEVTPDLLDKLADELDEIADELDEVEYNARACERGET